MNNNNLNLESEVSDILINTDFLRLVRSFISIYGVDEALIDEKESAFFEKLNNFKHKEENIEDFLSKNDLLDNLGFIFSHEEILSNFLEYINQNNIDKSIIDANLEIADYLIRLYDNKDMYPKDLDITSVRLKDKIGDILGKSEIENISLLLSKNNFPVIGKKGYPIVKADFDNMIDFYGDEDDEYLFLKVRDQLGNIFYHNYKGDIFLTNDGREIINVEYIYYFKEYSVLKVKTNDLRYSLEIRSKKGKTFDMPEGLGDILPGKLVDGDNELEYLTLSKSVNGVMKTTLFDIEGDTINLMDIIRFVNKGKDSTIKLLELTLKKFENIDVSSIKGIKTIGGVKFIELCLDLDNDDEDYLGEKEEFDIIIMDTGKPLTDDNGEYIKHLFETESFLGKELLGFGFTPFNIDGYIDSNGEVFTINDKLIHTISKFKGDSITDARGAFRHVFETLQGDTFSKINDSDRFIVKDTKIRNILDNLLGFNEDSIEKQKGFDLFFEQKDNLIVKERKIDQLSCFSDKGKLNILLYSNGASEAIEYKDLISELKIKREYGDILKEINILINTEL